MHERATELIRTLGMTAHPEGGYFREVFRSGETVRASHDRERSALTTIYFLLTAGAHSAWHRVRSDEAWHHYEGAPLELLVIDPGLTTLKRQLLGPVDENCAPVRVVPVECWQAARTTGDYTLVGCTVGPGFDFADFTMLRDAPEGAERLRHDLPEVIPFL